MAKGTFANVSTDLKIARYFWQKMLRQMNNLQSNVLIRIKF